MHTDCSFTSLAITSRMATINLNGHTLLKYELSNENKILTKPPQIVHRSL